MSEAWKGITASDVEVTTGMGGGDCGFEFQRGHEYLVVAFREDVRGRPFVATIYSGTTETTDADAADHLATLRAWRPPVKFDRVVPSPVARAVRR